MKESNDNAQRIMQKCHECRCTSANICRLFFLIQMHTHKPTVAHKHKKKLKTLKSQKLFWWCHSSAKFMSNNNLLVDKLQTRRRTTERSRIALFQECQSERAVEKKRTDEYFCARNMTKQISHLSFAMSLWHRPSKNAFHGGKKKCADV